MKLLLTLIIIVPSFLHGQIISTIAGTGIRANTGDSGLAISAEINYPIGGVFDKFNNYYFACGTGNLIRKISNSGYIYTIAGNGSGGDGGQAYSASLNNPQNVTVDSNGNIYIAEAGANKIRKIEISTGIITTIAGNGTAGFRGDNGQADSALLNYPLGLCFDKFENLYIADAGNNRVRKINSLGIISTFAGNGGVIFSGINGSATSASISAVQGLCIDDTGNLYLAVINYIFKVDLMGIITVFAGNGIAGYSGDGGPADSAEIGSQTLVWNKSGYIFTTEGSENRIRVINENHIINTLAGNGMPGFSGDGSISDSAEINNPAGITIDSCGNIYFGDIDNFRLRKIIFPTCNYLTINSLGNNDFTIYPNPAVDELHIDRILNMEKYRLLNIKNNITQAGNLQMGSNTIDIRALPPGMYFLEMTDEKGYRTIKKVIKE